MEYHNKLTSAKLKVCVLCRFFQMDRFYNWRTHSQLFDVNSKLQRIRAEKEQSRAVWALEQERKRQINEQELFEKMIIPTHFDCLCYRCWRNWKKVDEEHLCVNCKYTVEHWHELLTLEVEISDIPIRHGQWAWKRINISPERAKIIAHEQENSLTRIGCKQCWKTKLSETHRGYRDFCFDCMSHFRIAGDLIWVIFKDLPVQRKSARKI